MDIKIWGKIEGESNSLVSVGERVFKMSPVAITALQGLHDGKSACDIAAQINAANILPSTIYEGDVDHIITKIKAQIQPDQKHVRLAKRTSNLRLRTPLISGTKISPFLRMWTWLFIHPRIFYCVLIIAALINVYALKGESLHAVLDRSIWYLIPSVTIMMFVIGFLHECGHSTAALGYGTPPKDMGLGFYYCFPVWYTDLTDIWRLRISERITVNLSGICVQLLANIPFFLLLRATSSRFHDVILMLVWTNAIGVLTNIIPFAKLDGYWVLSDTLGCPHLEYDARTILFSRQQESKTDYTIWIYVYAILQLIYYIGIAFAFMYFVLPFFVALFHAKLNLPAIARVFAEHSLQSVAVSFLIIKLGFRLMNGRRITGANLS